MVPLSFDREQIERFLDAAAARLDGDWLLVDGAAAAIWFKSGRVTEDIDLVGFGGTTQERLQLMQLASEQGVPIEAVNSAADFFVHQIADWRARIEVLRRGPRATLYRPSPTLFLLLKIGRLSETDLEDCLDLLRFVSLNRLALDRRRVIEALDALPPTEDTRRLERQARLREVLGEDRRTPSPG